MSLFKKVGKKMRFLVRTLELIIFIPVFAVLVFGYFPLLQHSQSVEGEPLRIEVLLAMKHSADEHSMGCSRVTNRVFLDEFWLRPFMIGFDIYLTDHPEHLVGGTDVANRFGNLEYLDLPGEYGILLDYTMAERIEAGGFYSCALPTDFKYQAMDNWRSVLDDAKSTVLQDLANN